jgi:peptide/nickel transport system permease protein
MPRIAQWVIWPRRIAGEIASLILTALAGALFAATLVRLAPGADSDERDFDPRFSAASIQGLHDSRSADRHLAHYYAHYLGGLAHGDFGVSYSLKRPVLELLADRGPATLRLAGSGLIAGWALGLSLAILATQWRRGAFEWFTSSLSALLLCLPAALIGLLVLVAHAQWWWAIAAIVVPKVYLYARGLLEKVSREPHVLLAQAKGLGRTRILVCHMLPAILPELFALIGVSVSLAFSAAIPIEAVCDIPGVGQLAWQAALGRDLPVLVTMTMLLALITRVANATANLAIAGLPFTAPLDQYATNVPVEPQVEPCLESAQGSRIRGTR